MPRDVDVSHLHPAIRNLLSELDARLFNAGIPLQLYEGARSPFRQAELYARGRGTGTPGKHVTKARAWASFHNHGLAVDYVFKVDGNWTWDEPERGQWQKYQAIADALGLRSLSFEKPHVEVATALAPLQAGMYPPGGDGSWRDWLDEAIETWGPTSRDVGGVMHPGAPPLAIERPAEVA